MRALPVLCLAALPAPALAADYEARILADEASILAGSASSPAESLELPLSSGGEADGELAIHCRPGEEPWMNLLVDRDRRFPGDQPLDAGIAQASVDLSIGDLTVGAELITWGSPADPSSTAMVKVQGLRSVLAALDALAGAGSLDLALAASEGHAFASVALDLPESPDVEGWIRDLRTACKA